MCSQFLVLVRVLVHGVVLVLGDVLEVDVAVLVLQKLGQLLQYVTVVSVTIRAINEQSRSCTCGRRRPLPRAISLLKAPTSAFTINDLLRHY